MVWVGAAETTKLSVDASLAGAIIGKHGGNQKRIWRVTGAHFSIREHETDPNLRNIEFEGTCNQINDAIALFREQIEDISQVFRPNNFKTKLCKKFAEGSCTFGTSCRFAHSAEELRWSGT
uniref:C3H1-type domain-containing protein n=1 Tax=Manihot esculenta TaxID=3983 RepID=A0A2C9VFV0_MANES